MNSNEKAPKPIPFISALVPVALFLIGAVPLTAAATPLLLTTSFVGRLVFIALSPVIFLATFLAVAAMISIPFQGAIIPGKFPRKLNHPVYGPRRIYGLCWGSVFYFTPIYYALMSVPLFKKIMFYSFGYRGNSDVTIAPDAWIRDLPLLKFSKGVYVANKATIGTNICLANGSILVDAVTLGEGAMVGHLAMVAPGCKIGDRAEVGVGSAIGIRATLGNRVRIGGTCSINHGSVIADKAEIGTMCYIGVKATIGTEIKIPGGTTIPDGVVIETHDDVVKYTKAETDGLIRQRSRLQRLYKDRHAETTLINQTADAIVKVGSK